DARGGVYSNDPHSHGDVYTSLEACSGILAALYQRERTGRGQWIDISMAQTLLYVNEHLHDALWDGDEDPGWLRSFRPGDYAVVAVANGEQVIVSGHLAERGTFELFVAAMDAPALLEEPRFATVASRLEHLEDLRSTLADFAATVPDAATFEEIFSRHKLAV